jgi:hypothetical protein
MGKLTVNLDCSLTEALANFCADVHNEELFLANSKAFVQDQLSN